MIHPSMSKMYHIEGGDIESYSIYNLARVSPEAG